MTEEKKYNWLKKNWKNSGKHKVEMIKVLNFYEPFLQKINSMHTRTMGVYYTPIPVVSLIVRSLYKILRQYFRMQNGF